MIDKFCRYLTSKIRKQMPEVDDEQAEVIHFGVQLIVGEIPKFFLILPYKVYSGGFHLKTHLGCILCTNLIYCGNAYISTNWNFPNEIVKYITILAIWIFGIIMVSIYAPADTENVPIISKKERKNKKILSYVFLNINMIVAIFVPNAIVSNILIFGTFAQTVTITKIAYRITNNKSGYEEYLKAQ